MANKVYSSAGVYSSEKNLTFAVETIGVTTLGLVGETQKGPAFQPFFVRNYDEFKTFFGGTNPEKFRNTQIPKFELPYISKSYLTQSNQLYVTRILGLSGYNAGPAWAITTLGMCDVETLTNTKAYHTFKFAEVGTEAYLVDEALSAITETTLLEKLEIETGVDSTKYDATTNTFFTISDSSAPYQNDALLHWGPIPENALSGIPGSVSGDTYNAYELPSDVPASDETSHWLINNFIYDSGNDNYDGMSFATYVNAIGSQSLDDGDGNISVYPTFTITLQLYESECEPKAEYHNKLVTTIRSGGTYINNELTFNLGEKYSDVSLSGMTNIYDDFNINVASGDTYTVSMDTSKKNYIKKVLGSSLNERGSDIWVENTFDSALLKGYTMGLIKGLNPTLTYTTTWNHYEQQYQTPVTPFFVSELRGGTPMRLFRFITISDGEGANTEAKVSIVNVDLNKKTFDVYIRAFNDTDKRIGIIERYLNCNLDPTSDNYIGRKIGTSDNKFDLNSSYVMVHMDDNAPVDAVPAGFEGYDFRNVGATQVTPEISYKTKYYIPGETMYDPILGDAVISSGDKVRKAYLGFSDLEFNYDNDLLKYIGKSGSGYNGGADWLYKTKGFHMDINAGSIINELGDYVFEVGAGTFTDASVVDGDSGHVYNDIKTRKFTALFSGGFDGWDIHRDYRTNEDTYKLGRTGFVASEFDQFYSSEYDETMGTSDYYAYLYGVKTFENPEDVSINIFATPGIDVVNNTDLVRDAIEIVEEKRLDTIYLPTLPDIKLIGNTSPSNTDDWYYPNDIVTELEGTEIDTSYSSVYYPWMQVFDSENNANLFLPPTAEVIRNLALTDNVAHPWYATAGYSRGLVNAKRTRIKLDQEQRDVLVEGKINPLATYPDVNVVIWGNRTLQDGDDALAGLNVRRLLLQAKRLITSVSKRLLFDPNDERVRSEFLSLVNPILDNIRKERGLYDFRVTVSNDAEDLDKKILRGRIFLKPARTLEFIELEFNITPTSVSFESIL